MAGRGILQADMATVVRWLRGGWRWWTSELVAMVPSWLRFAPRAVLVVPGRAGGEPWVRPDGAAELSTRDRGRVTLGLAPENVLVRTVDTLPLSPSETRQMIGFDLDRLTPYPAGTAIFDLEKLARQDGQSAERTRIGILPLDRAQAWLRSAEEAGLAPSRMALLDADGALHFDFLPMLRDTDRSGRGVPIWWVVVTLLFLANVAMLVWRDIASVDALRLAVEEQAPAARTATLLSRRITRENDRRARLVSAQAREDPLRVLDGISAVLPAGVWVQRLSWDGAELRLTGYAPEGVDVQDALLASPLVRTVEANDMEATVQPSGSGQPQPFDVSLAINPPGSGR